MKKTDSRQNLNSVCFRDSELISGNIGKNTLGDSKSGLFYSLLKDNSKHVAAVCMLRFAKMSARWLTNFGMTLSLQDVTPQQSLTNFKVGLIQERFEICADLVKKYQRGELRVKPGGTAESTLESEVSSHLNEIRDEAGKYCFSHLPRYNSALTMAVCGSKGSNMNLCQMIACVGQQIVSGKRVSNGFTFRTLPHFQEHSKEPKARGFVANSFFTGLAPTEFFFHTMAGREGLIDTAVKTANTGYMQRRLVKAMEDIVVYYDGSVRNAEGNIIQFLYGDDGLDPIHCEEYEGFPLDLERLLKYSQTYHPRKPRENGMSPEEIETNSKILIRKLCSPGDNVTSEGSNQAIDEAKNSAVYTSSDGILLARVYVEKLIGFWKKYSEKVKEAFPERTNYYSASLGITEKQLETFFEKLKFKLIRARVSAGDGVGATTAQSIGEPCTQMTLKTFHFAGVASMNVTMGVPRINEIVNASVNIQTPIIEVFLRNSTDVLSAKIVKNTIHPILVESILEHITEVYEDKGCYLDLQLDMKLIKAKMLHVTSEQVAEAIVKAKLRLKPKHVSVMPSGKIRVQSYDNSEREMIFILKHLKNKIRKIKVGGVGQVRRALISFNPDEDEKEYKVYAEG